MPLDPLTIISAIVAILVIWKLRSVLGQRTGAEKPPSRTFVDPPESTTGPQPAPPPAPRGGTSGNVVRLPGSSPDARPAAPDPDRWRGFAEPGSPIAAGLDAIAARDPGFAPRPFLDGAKIAHETVIAAFAAGDRKALEGLLSKETYAGFAAALDDRARKGETLTTTFVSSDDTRIETAALEGRTARIGVRFASKQISATHASDGTLADGSPDQIVDMDDIWTFARDVQSRDPNWKLVATQSGH